MAVDPTRIFISYTQADRAWAKWIARQLEDTGYQPILQAWSFHAGSRFVDQMDRAVQEADRTLAVLSPRYERSDFCRVEWQAAFHRDLTEEGRRLIPVRVEDFEPRGLLATIIYIDLVGLSEDRARRRLLEGLTAERPSVDAAFPSRMDDAPRESAPQYYPANDPPFWNVPHRRNPFFTGREDLLEQLHNTFHRDSDPPYGQAIRGLGGVGKTQTAVEYAYRYRDQYAAVLWARASNETQLVAAMAAIAAVLGLPVKKAPEQEIMAQAVRRWLESNDKWLLVLDNANKPGILEPLLPTSPSGHILATSRARSFDELDLEPLLLATLTSEEAEEFLLARAGLEAPGNEEREAARELATELGCLPLALEQAAAFVAGRSRYVDYLVSYRRRRLELLKKGRPRDYPDSLATTWSLNLGEVEETSPAASRILRVSAFLSPHRIPHELLTQGAAELGETLATALGSVDDDPIALDELLEPLAKYSLIERHVADRSFSVHRLVQEVVLGEIEPDSAQRWAERVVRALNRTFPDVDFSNWTLCDRLASHARSCSRMIAGRKLEVRAAGELLNKAGVYAHERGRFRDAAALFEQSLAIRQRILAAGDPAIAESLNSLANAYRFGGDPGRAVPLYLRAVAILGLTEGTQSAPSELAQVLNNLACSYGELGAHEQALPLHERALSIYEQALGEDHPATAACLNDLAILYSEQGRYAKAAPLFERALAIRQRTLADDHPDVAASLSGLAGLYTRLKDFPRAVVAGERALEISRRNLGEDHPRVGAHLNNLAELYRAMGEPAKAEPLLERSLVISRQALGSDHPGFAQNLMNLGLVYSQLDKPEQALALLEQALGVFRQTFGENHPDVASTLNILANLHCDQKNYEKAEPLFQRALAMRERTLGLEHPLVAESLFNLGLFYSEMGRYAKAPPLVERALAISEKALGPDHPTTRGIRKKVRAMKVGRAIGCGCGLAVIGAITWVILLWVRGLGWFG